MCLSGQPAIDTGGVRRQVFSQVFKSVAYSVYLMVPLIAVDQPFHFKPNGRGNEVSWTYDRAQYSSR